MKNIIERFNSVTHLKTNLENEIKDVEQTIQDYSDLLGEKIRINEESFSEDLDFIALKEKLNDESLDKKSSDKKSSDKKSSDKKSSDKKSSDKKSSDKKSSDKKVRDKKKKSKKNLSDKWFNLNEIHVYNGMGLKGEMELYFKAVDELKSKLENLQRCLATLNNVIEKGLKDNMSCIAFRGIEGIVEIAFLKSANFRQNYSLKSIYTGSAIPIENRIKVGV